jgi:ABC-type amino acid transport substrate-binding protein
MFAAGLGTAAALLLLKDAPAPPSSSHSLLPPEQAGEIVVIVYPGPVVYFPGPNGTLAGLDVDLAREFAQRRSFRCDSSWPILPRR